MLEFAYPFGVFWGILLNFGFKVSRLVEDSRKKGAKVVVGGKHHELGGNFYEPTLVTDVQLNMDIAQEEIFGPVASIIK